MTGKTLQNSIWSDSGRFVTFPPQVPRIQEGYRLVMDAFRPVFRAVFALSVGIHCLASACVAQSAKPASSKIGAAGQPAEKKPTGGAVTGKSSSAAATKTPTAPKGPPVKKEPVRQAQGTDEDLEPSATDAETGTADNAPPGRLPARTAAPRGGKSAGNGAERLPRPEAEPLRIQKLSPELEQILRNWEQQTAKITKLQGDTRYREYDKTFSVEYRGEGRFAFEAPDRGNYELRPAKISKGETSSVKTDDKQPYELKPKDAERWICTGAEILRIDETHKTYEVVPIPEERRGDRIIEAPLPFLFGMKAEQAKQRYQIELVKDAEQEIVLKLRPNWSGDAANWSQATVVIQKTNYLPREVRLIAPGGTSMRIHSFENIKVNSDNLFRSLFGDDPFKPKLKNYKVVNNDRGPEDAPVTADRPDTSGKVRPSSAETPTPTKGVRPAAPKPSGEAKRPPAGR